MARADFGRGPLVGFFCVGVVGLAGRTFFQFKKLTMLHKEINNVRDLFLVERAALDFALVV